MDVVKIETRDVVLVADRITRSNAPLIILSPGGGQTRQSWRAAAEEIAALGFETVSVDLRGHGESGWATPDHYRLRDFADDQKAIVAQFGGGRPVGLIGASLGGLAALLAASDADVKIDLVVMVDSVPRFEPKGAARIRGFMERYPEGFSSLDEAAQAVAEYRGRGRQSTDGLARNLRRGAFGRLYWHWDPAFLANREPWSERIVMLEGAARDYHGPLMLVRGLHSDVVSDEGVAAFQALAPQLERLNIVDAGHMVVGDRNDIFVDGIADFLNRTIAPEANS